MDRKCKDTRNKILFGWKVSSWRVGEYESRSSQKGLKKKRSNCKGRHAHLTSAHTLLLKRIGLAHPKAPCVTPVWLSEEKPSVWRGDRRFGFFLAIFAALQGNC